MCTPPTFLCRHSYRSVSFTGVHLSSQVFSHFLFSGPRLCNVRCLRKLSVYLLFIRPHRHLPSGHPSALAVHTSLLLLEIRIFPQCSIPDTFHILSQGEKEVCCVCVSVPCRCSLSPSGVLFITRAWSVSEARETQLSPHSLAGRRGKKEFHQIISSPCDTSQMSPSPWHWCPARSFITIALLIVLLSALTAFLPRAEQQ